MRKALMAAAVAQRGRPMDFAEYDQHSGHHYYVYPQSYYGKYDSTQKCNLAKSFGLGAVAFLRRGQSVFGKSGSVCVIDGLTVTRIDAVLSLMPSRFVSPSVSVSASIAICPGIYPGIYLDRTHLLSLHLTLIYYPSTVEP